MSGVSEEIVGKMRSNIAGKKRKELFFKMSKEIVGKVEFAQQITRFESRKILTLNLVFYLIKLRDNL